MTSLGNFLMWSALWRPSEIWAMFSVNMARMRRETR
jgi:hypothetical protein